MLCEFINWFLCYKRRPKTTHEIAMWQALDWLIRREARQSDKLNRILENQEKIMASIDDLVAAATQESNDEDSVLAVLVTIQKQLADVLSGATLPPDVQTKVDALFAEAQANSAKLAAAIATPAP